MVHRSCALARFYYSTFSPPLSLWQLRLVFFLLLCLSVISTSLSVERLLIARLLSQQPFLHFSALICSAFGLIQCRGNQLQATLCLSHTTKRLRRATLCAAIAITLSTLASLPTPTSAAITAPKSALTHLDLWHLLALTLCIQICLPTGRIRHLICGVITLAHAMMVIVTRFTSLKVDVPSGASGCFFCWNSTDVRFWREVSEPNSFAIFLEF